MDEYGDLRPGMNVNAEIVVEQASDAIAVPNAAIERGDYVLVTTASPSAANADPEMTAPEGYVYVSVETGVSDDNYTEITAGLQEGDIIGYVASETFSYDDYNSDGYSAANKLGALAVGAFTVAQRIDVLAVQCLLSFGITMATYTAQNYGAGDIPRIRQGVRQGSIVSVAFAVISGILILLAADFSVRLFLGKNITDPAQIEETIRLAKVYLTINCSMYVFLALLLLRLSGKAGSRKRRRLGNASKCT